ncbi:restriction endonuclease subunit S [Methylomonas albis]|uniref:Restriction endonuclease subunit S n=1 Tax=Methylomonas albis TaxID=1854563 RepID=A0ABR9D5X1_9GAMM|nr:restriction endonuclease subunit S [Methylomonas albis]MBD9357262.1 restriction endonuclease subunit S [Methylomonas albis]
MPDKINAASWWQTTLGEIAVEQVNNGIFRKNPEYLESDSDGDGMPVVWVEELFKGNQICTEKSRRLKPTSTEIKKYGLRHGDILFCRSSLKLDGIGFSNVYAGEDFQALFECHVIRISPNPNLVFPKFLNHLLRTEQLRNLIKSRSKTSTMTTIDQKGLCAVPIRLPGLADQRRIAAILDQADVLRAKRREALAQLDSLTQSIFVEMFGTPGNNSNGWKCCAVGDVTDCIVPGRDKPKSFTGNIPWVTTDDLAHLDFTYCSTKGFGLSTSEIDEVKARVIPAESVIISCVGNLGIATIAAEEIVINQQLHSFQCHDHVNNIYLMYCLAKQTAYMYAKASSTTLPYMNKSVCNSIPVQLPPVELQREFSSRVLAINVIKEKHRVFLAELDSLFASLQHRAFRGEL